MKLVIGLGNPDAQYENTRHNVGFKAVDCISSRLNLSYTQSKFNAQLASCSIKGDKHFFIKPQTYMNNSGQAARAIMDYYKIPLEDVCVIHDDLDLKLADVRIKRGGGHGGHNGLRSLDSHIGPEYLRIRIGIGRPEHSGDVSNYVLHAFANSEWQYINPVLDNVAQNIDKVYSETPARLSKLLRVELIDLDKK